MVVFVSQEPSVTVPEHMTVWEWLFEYEENLTSRKRSNKPLGAFVDSETKQRLDWEDVESQSTALSTYLVHKLGLKPADTVTIFSGNTIWYPVCMFAVIRAGGRINGASAAYTVDEMAYALRVSKARFVFTAPAALQTTLAAAALVGLTESNVFLIHDQFEDRKSAQDLIYAGRKLPPVSPFRMPTGMTNREVCGYLNFSSGTTGLPKAVMISHHNVIAQCYQMRRIQVDPENVKILAIMPLYHGKFLFLMSLTHTLIVKTVTGTWRFCHYSIFMNADTIMLSSFSMQAMLEAIVHFRVEELILVPPILLRLARDTVVDKYDLSHVLRWTSGAAPISPEVLRSLEQRFPLTGFRQGYGATEAAVIAAQPPSKYAWKYGASAGTLLPNTTAKIIDSEGKELGVGEAGEILAKGPQVAMGYLDNQEATAESFDAEGFYHTGDAGYIDQEGFVYVRDRLKEMIKVKGSQVPPAELEDLLLGHPIVADCAVVAQPNDYSGELPKAYVVLKEGVPMDDQAGQSLIAYVKTKKIRYKWIAEVEFIDKIPKSPAGKLLRRVLQAKETIGQGASMGGRDHGHRVIDASRLR